jgi:hypothetical protein
VLARDSRSTEQLKADLTKLVKEALAHQDAKVRSVAKRHGDANYALRKQLREAEKELKDLIGSPAISGEILALIERLDAWAALDGGAAARTPDDRRQRILDLARALRAQPQHSELPAASQLGSHLGRIVQRVEEECSRLRPNASAEDSDVLAVLPSYARLLGFHVAHRALTAARAKGADPPESATRLLSLWPERAANCWDTHQDWAETQGAAVFGHLSKPWAVKI